MPSKRVSASKSVGVKIDKNLTWHFHDRDVQKHLYWGAVIFGVFRPGFSPHTPCCSSWSFYSKTVAITSPNEMHTNSYTGPRL